MAIPNGRWIARWFVCSALLGGCGEEIYRYETRLHSDGSLERAIYQPRSETPEEAIKPVLWQAITFANERTHESWDGPISKLPWHPDDEKHDYVAAWGSFESPAKIPDHYVKPTPDGKQAGRFVRHYERTDLVLLTVHQWQETLTDVVRLDDMRRARRELAELVIGLADEVLRTGLGKEYDAAPLIAWLRADGTHWFEELIDVVFDLALRDRLNADKLVAKRLAAVCARRGLNLTDAQGDPLEGDEAGRILVAFAEARIRKLVRRKDGKPLDESTVELILNFIDLVDTEDEDGPNPLETLAQTVIVRRFGSREAFDKKLSILLTRIFGVYNADFLSPPRRFHASLRVPGVIVKTNGRLTGTGRVEWSFDAADAFPFGYPMTCRSLEPNLIAQKKLLKRAALTERATLVRFHDLVSGNDSLLDALRKSLAAETLDPLEALVIHFQLEQDEKAEMSAKRLLRLLKRK